MSTDHPVASDEAVQAPSASAPPTAPDTPAQPSDDAPATENGGQEARRVRLNPTFQPSQPKPIPSIAGSATISPPAEPPNVPSSPSPAVAAELEVEPEAPPAAAEEKPAEPPKKRAEPVAVPKSADLDAEMEAEIEAAMSSGELDLVPQTAAVAATEESEAARPPEDEVEAGLHLTGRIQTIHGDSVFLDLGYRSPGVVQLRQFTSGKKPEVGQQIEVVVDKISAEEGLIHVNLPKGLRRVSGNWDALSKGQIVDCIVNRTNKGGLEVTVGGLRAFLPLSQVDIGPAPDLESLVNQKLRVEIVEVNPKKRNLIVSRRAYLQIERQEAQEKLWQTLEVGQTFSGKVKTIKDYGAFVDLGGVDGFLHIGEMSWQRIKHPSEAVKEGQQVDVKVLALDPEKKKISLGMKQLVQNPWTNAAEKYPANSTITGKVTRVAEFGAFVELEPGLEGLVHVSEIEHKHVRRASDVLKPHQSITAQVLEVDTERKRVSLSIKALQAKPEEAKAPEVPVEQYQRKHKGPLRGGTGGETAGGLFGNPSSFR